MPKKLNSPTAYGIWRGIRCWNVAVQRGRVRYIDQFPDDLYGGPEIAFRAAQSRRDAIVQAHPPEPRKVKASKIRVNNKSGVAGVSVTHDVKGNPLAWKAKTRVGDTTWQKTFTVKKWGSAARELAIKEREKQLLNFKGLSYIHPAERELRMGKRSVAPEEVSSAELAQAWMTRGRSTNQSGTPGVVRRKGRGSHPGYWTAQSSADGRWQSKSFSVALFGEDEAKRLAIEERAAQLTQLISRRRSEKDASALE